MELDYSLGLQRVQALLPLHDPRTTEKFDPLSTRLTHNLAERERYGHYDANTVEFNHVIRDLDKFIDEYLHLDVHFIDLCTCDGAARAVLDEQLPAVPPVPEAAGQFRLWQVGDRLSVQGEHYYLDGSIDMQWLDEGGALFQQAAGRQARSGQKVWLKQCQVARAQGAALTLKRDLEKEESLLSVLQKEGQRDFPRVMGSESNVRETTLVREMLDGPSLASAFDGLPKPLDQQAARHLFKARHSLISMLHVLHKKQKSHRMLTPETLLLLPRANKMILQDLGLAARTVQLGEGPRLYQSPEQVRGLPAPNSSTDIYQLGALFYDLLMGRHITDASPVQESGLEPELIALLRKAAAPLPRDRWPDVYAFSNALSRLGY